LIIEDPGDGSRQRQPGDLGKAQITISKDSTTIIAAMHTRCPFAERAASIKRELEVTDSDYDKEKLN